MTIKELKSDLESGKFTNNTLILKYADDTFLTEQYVDEIKKILNLTPTYIEGIEDIPEQNAFFGLEEANLYIYKCDKLNYIKPQTYNYLIVITNKITNELESEYKDIIIEMPKLEKWQIKDYVHSNLDGIKTEYIDWLLDNTNYGIYRLQTEIDKLSIFEQKEKNIVFQKMLDDNAFDDITKYNIWDFTNCIINKNVEELINIYMDINNIEMEPMGVLSSLYQNFRKLIMVWMNKNPIPDNTGLTTKQIYAINKLPRVWSSEQLVNILKFLTDLDFKIKTGQLPIEHLRDYMVINIMSL